MNLRPPAMRQWLYVLNLAVGMMLFVCAFSFMGAVSRSITQGIDRLGSDAVVVSTPDLPFATGRDPRALDHGDVERLRAAIGEDFEVAAVARSVLPVIAGAHEQLATVWQVEPTFFRVAGLALAQGRTFSDYEARGRAELCLVSADVGEAIPGSNLGADANLLVGGRPCTVIGTVSSAETLPNFSVAQAVYVPFASGENPLESAPVTQIFLRHRGGPPDAAAANAIRSALPVDRPVDIWFASEFWALRTNIANSLWLLVLLMSCVVLGMAALGLSNSLSLDVLQRRGEIGLRIALGATRRDIFAMFLGQGLAVVALGGVLGAAAGAIIVLAVLGPLVSGSDLLAGSEMSLDGGTMAAALAVLSLTSILACLVPARRAMQVDPSLAVRSL